MITLTRASRALSLALLLGASTAFAQAPAGGPTWPPVEWSAGPYAGGVPDSLLPPAERDPARRLGLSRVSDIDRIAPETRAADVSAGDDRWEEIVTLSAREGTSAIQDPLHQRIVVFGGWDGFRYRNDVWALSLAGPPAWTRLIPSGTPPSGRVGQSAVLDPLRGRMIVFGGTSDGSDELGDAWALTLDDTPTWSRLAASGSGPAGRCFSSAVYDPQGDRLVVFGGSTRVGSTTVYLNDSWSLRLSVIPPEIATGARPGDGPWPPPASPAGWTRLATSGVHPAARHAHTAVYDSARSAMLVFGGYAYAGGSSRYLNDVWRLSLTGDPPRWDSLPVRSAPPPGRAGHACVWDRARERMVILGGDSWDGSYHYFGDAWALTPGDSLWTCCSNSLPARAGQAAGYDPGRDSVIVFGGYTYDRSYRLFSDTWAVGLATEPAGCRSWCPLGDPPMGREQCSGVLVPSTGSLLVFGGYSQQDTSAHYLNDVCSLSLAEPAGWTTVAVTGTPPHGRYGQSTIRDPLRERMIVFGGYYYAGGYHYLDDVWALALSGERAWTLLAPAGGPPPARSGQSAVYDPVRDRMLVFGGFSFNGTYTYYDDVWSLSLGATPTWARIATGPGPAPRAGQAAVYDPRRDRLLVVGGYTYAGGVSTWHADAWALALDGSGTWQQVTTPGDSPCGRAGHAAVYDAGWDRVWVIGGFHFDTAPRYLNDCWSLVLSDASPWWAVSRAPTAMPPRSGHVAVYDSAAGRILVQGGKGGSSSYLQDAWALTPHEPAAVPAPGTCARLALLPCRPNPGRGPITITFTLSAPADVRLRIVDVAGRTLALPRSARLEAGSHQVTWNGRDASGREAPAGVYFCELSAGAGAARRVRRIVRLN